MSREHQISEAEYDHILASNRDHGATLFTDLYVAETYLPQLDTPLPKILPKSVKPTNSWGLFVMRRQEPIEGIESTLDGKTLRYLKLFNSEDKLRSLSRAEYIEDRLTVTSSFMPIGSHYHVSSRTHWAHDQGLGQPVIGLGSDIPNFDAALNTMYREVMLYLGEEQPEPSPYPSLNRRPPVDLGLATFRPYVMGFREKAIELRRDDILARVDILLDRMPIYIEPEE